MIAADQLTIRHMVEVSVSRTASLRHWNRRLGRWKSYLFGARVSFMLSLLAKSALAWQVFAGTVAG